ncbi:short-chain dehydrogenase/ reductase [Microdochium trichocladiopsis]|uniref:Short-chain dehydrogenase/ reductase n=1 Tax=Microdochium trichocladiopsis TaxID=1682393 RepID=A0A9P8XS06_9PEZI|nr:short-chain dehydrogenase/ reductase [Microdochium trichocladiopsis]KAH7014435.1 short-chain dehydrogenase/ reductase [Microdochium trichocladiopsis]
MAPRYNNKTKGSDLAAELADNIKGKTVLVTGASPGGIGALYAKAIARASPAQIILTGRTTASIEATAKWVAEANSAVKTTMIEMSLDSLSSVRGAAREVMDSAEVSHIDVLVLNAGIMAVPYGKTKDGFEMQFGVNHLGHFVFANLVMPKVLEAAFSPGSSHVGFQDGKVYEKWSAYGQSKTGNNLFALSLATKLGSRGLQAFSLHPGVYMSNLTRDVDFSEGGDGPTSLRQADERLGNPLSLPNSQFDFCDEETIVATHIFTSFSDDIRPFNGQHFTACNVAQQDRDEVWPWANNAVEAERLWRLSEDMVGERFAY